MWAATESNPDTAAILIDAVQVLEDVAAERVPLDPSGDIANHVRETARTLRARTHCWLLIRFIELAWPELYPDTPFESTTLVQFLTMLIEKYGPNPAAARRAKFEITPATGAVAIVPDRRDVG